MNKEGDVLGHLNRIKMLFGWPQTGTSTEESALQHHKNCPDQALFEGLRRGISEDLVGSNYPWSRRDGN